MKLISQSALLLVVGVVLTLPRGSWGKSSLNKALQKKSILRLLL